MKKIFIIALSCMVLVTLPGCVSVANAKETELITTSKSEPASANTPIPTTKLKAINTPVPTPEWNLTDLNALSNGNIAIAVSILESIADVKAGAESADVSQVIKTPWNYYGKNLIFTGTVAVVDDYPPGSDVSTSLKCVDSAEIVLLSDDGSTIIDTLLRRSSKEIKVGDYITIYGYAVGRMEVENRVGGTFTHLIIVSNEVK